MGIYLAYIIGAQGYALLSIAVISLIMMVFYVRKDRESFEKKVYREVHHWQIKGDWLCVIYYLYIISVFQFIS